MQAPYAIQATAKFDATYFEAFNTPEEAKQSTLIADLVKSEELEYAKKILTYSINEIPQEHKLLLEDAKIFNQCKLFNLAECNLPKMKQQLCDNGFTFIKMDEQAREKLNNAARTSHNILNDNEPNASYIDKTDQQYIQVLEQYAISENTKELVTAIVKKVQSSYTSEVKQAISSYFQNNTVATNEHIDHSWALIMSANLSKGTSPTVIYTKDKHMVEVPDGYAVLFTGGSKKHSSTESHAVIDKLYEGKGLLHRGGEDLLGVRTNLTQRFYL